MNFERTNTKISLIEDYYNHFDEDQRLKRRHGQVEFKTSMKYIRNYLGGDLSKKILDIGAGTGAYSIPLSEDGYDVCAVELVKRNIETLKKNGPKVNAIQGNALDLTQFKNDSFDLILLFGPMYHLLKDEDKIKALSEAKRVLKPGGVLLTSYYMNEYAILTYGFIKGNILDSIKTGRIDEKYHVVAKDDDLYSMVRLEDINEFNETLNLKRIKIIAQDGASDYIRTSLNKLTDEEFDEYIKYHMSICERCELLGSSSHVLDIVTK